LAIEGFAGVTAIDCSVAAVTVRVVVPATAPEVALMVEVPTAKPEDKPPAVIVAVAGVAELHVTLPVKFCVLLSLNVPVAVNCCVKPLAMDEFAGVTAIDCSVAAVTVRVVEPVMELDFALMDEVPVATAVANPAALIVATLVVADAHVTVLVKFCVLLSLKVPVAVNCCVNPLATDGFAGVTAMDCSVAAVTVRVVAPATAPEVALIVEVPTAMAVAKPLAAMVAVAGVAELHVTLPVRFCVLLSLKVPVAVNCCVRPFAMDGFPGVTAMDCSVAAVTVRVVDPVIDPDFALMEEVPAATAVASPAALMVATVVVADAQVTLLVKFCVLLSLNVPVAVNCCVNPLAMEGFAGVTAIETSVGALTVSVVLPVVLPDFAEMLEVPRLTAVARPAAVIVATAGVAELHVTLPVKFCVLLSLNVPVAVNCWVEPLVTVGLAGVTAMDTSTGVTASDVVPVVLPTLAEIVADPAPTPLAKPPAVIVATDVVPELHTTLLVRFFVLLSE
jgi:hypothetical protein